MTRDELKAEIDELYDEYLDALDKLAEEAGIAPASPREVQDNPATSAAAAAAWATFQHRQDELNAEYFAPRDANALAREKAAQAVDDQAVHLRQAQANLEQAYSFLDQERRRVAAMRSAGIVVTAAEEAGIIAAAQAKIDHWQQEVDGLRL